MDSNARPEVIQLIETVIEGGYCIGCGACAAVPDSPLEMVLDESGRFQARLRANLDGTSLNAPVLTVCPFSGVGPNEDALASSRFGDHEGVHHDHRLGHYLALYAGHVREDGFRASGSSGGLTTWLLVELLANDLIDRVVHVRPTQNGESDGLLFRYECSSAADQVRDGAKSRYYPVQLADALQMLRDSPARYAVVGVPCFIKAVRRLADSDPTIRQRITTTVAIFCGHLKSTHFADLLAWQCGIEPGSLNGIDFRRKLLDRPANRYGVEVTGPDRKAVVRPMEGMAGQDWGHGMFKYEACDYCDDVAGETADVATGDAWLPSYVDDSAGTNVLIVRNPHIGHIIETARDARRLSLDRITPSAVAASQASSLRHRRDGLAYRLALKDDAGEWRPPKRVPASKQHLDRGLKRLFRYRIQLARLSHGAYNEAVAQGSLGLFRRRLRPLMERHDAARGQLLRRVRLRTRQVMRVAVRSRRSF